MTRIQRVGHAGRARFCFSWHLVCQCRSPRRQRLNRACGRQSRCKAGWAAIHRGGGGRLPPETRNGAGAMDFVGSGSREPRRDTTDLRWNRLRLRRGVSGFRTRARTQFVQQYIWKAGVARSVVSFRSRVEERFVSGYDGMLIRMRQQVRVSWPLAGRRYAEWSLERCVSGPTPRCGRLAASTAAGCSWASGAR